VINQSEASSRMLRPWLGQWEAVAGATDEDLCAAFEEWLERKDPAPGLRLER